MASSLSRVDRVTTDVGLSVSIEVGGEAIEIRCGAEGGRDECGPFAICGLEHMDKYAIRLRNAGPVRNQVAIEIDGKSRGALIFGAGDQVALERSVALEGGDLGQFTFVHEVSNAAAASAVSVGYQKNGLIVLDIKPEDLRPVIPLRECNSINSLHDKAPPRMSAAAFPASESASVPSSDLAIVPLEVTDRADRAKTESKVIGAGATVLSGISTQRFIPADPILRFDWRQVCTIRIKLVCVTKRQPILSKTC